MSPKTSKIQTKVRDGWLLLPCVRKTITAMFWKTCRQEAIRTREPLNFGPANVTPIPSDCLVCISSDLPPSPTLRQKRQLCSTHASQLHIHRERLVQTKKKKVLLPQKTRGIPGDECRFSNYSLIPDIQLTVTVEANDVWMLRNCFLFIIWTVYPPLSPSSQATSQKLLTRFRQKLGWVMCQILKKLHFTKLQWFA